MPAPTRAEAEARARLLNVHRCTVPLELTEHEEEFVSRAEIRRAAREAAETAGTKVNSTVWSADHSKAHYQRQIVRTADSTTGEAHCCGNARYGLLADHRQRLAHQLPVRRGCPHLVREQRPYDADSGTTITAEKEYSDGRVKVAAGAADWSTTGSTQ